MSAVKMIDETVYNCGPSFPNFKKLPPLGNLNTHIEKARINSSYSYESVPDDENGSGGFVFRGSKDHSDFPGLPGLQQQTQDTLSRYVLHILTRLYTNTQKEG